MKKKIIKKINFCIMCISGFVMVGFDFIFKESQNGPVKVLAVIIFTISALIWFHFDFFKDIEESLKRLDK